MRFCPTERFRAIRRPAALLALALALHAGAADAEPSSGLIDDSADVARAAPTVAPALPPPQSKPTFGVEGVDDRVPADSAVWPWTAIGRLNREVGGHCTAALIGPREVLTAAHCLYNNKDDRWTVPSDVHFVAGYHKGAFAGHAVAVRFIIAPGYDPKHATVPREMALDWAILELDRTLEIEPISLSTRAMPEIMAAAHAGEMNVAGYAADFGEILTRDQGCELLGETPDTKLLVHRCDVTYGVSGAPLLLLEDGKAEIIGIHNAVAGTGAEMIATAVPVWAFEAGVAKLLSAR